MKKYQHDDEDIKNCDFSGDSEGKEVFGDGDSDAKFEDSYLSRCNEELYLQVFKFRGK